MIRLATQWLAACSVLATFDLTQIPLSEGEESRRFPWPAEVTAAMQRLFETMTLTPSLISIDLAMQCFAQARELP